MSKSILVIDTPSNCSECNFVYDSMGCIITGTSFWKNYNDNFDPDIEKLHDCPLSPLPSYKDVIIQRGDGKSMTHLMMNLHNTGYNDCLNDILKENSQSKDNVFKGETEW